MPGLYISNLRSGRLRLLPVAVVLGGAGLAGCGQARQVSKLAPPVSAPMTRQVINAVDAGDGDYQIKVLRARLDADPRDLSARLELAEHYRLAGFPEIALEHCRLACERAPESAEAHLALARMLRAEGQPTAAMRELAGFLEKHDAGVQVWAWLGLLHDETGDWKEGEAAHRKAVALAPGRDDLRNNLGYCLLRQGRGEEAAAEFQAALRINPQSVIARNNLGLAVAGNPADAVLNWQSVSDPASAHNNMAAVLIDAGKFADARREIDLALGYNQMHSAALNNLRLVSRLDGKPAEVALPVAGAAGRFARLRAVLVRKFWRGKAAEAHAAGLQTATGVDNKAADATASR